MMINGSEFKKVYRVQVVQHHKSQKLDDLIFVGTYENKKKAMRIGATKCQEAYRSTKNRDSYHFHFHVESYLQLATNLVPERGEEHALHHHKRSNKDRKRNRE